MQGRHHDGLFYIHTGKGMLVSASVLQRINRAVENHFHRARGVTLAAVAALTVAALVPTSVWNANVVGARSLTASSAAATSPARAVESLDGGDGPDPATSTYEATWETNRVDGKGAFPAGSVTEIAVPSSTYPTGYIVAVHGGEVRSVEDAGILLIRSTGAEPVTVRVTAKAS